MEGCELQMTLNVWKDGDNRAFNHFEIYNVLNQEIDHLYYADTQEDRKVKNLAHEIMIVKHYFKMNLLNDVQRESLEDKCYSLIFKIKGV